MKHKFNFKDNKQFAEIPLYDKNKGYGFIEKTSAYPNREVHTNKILKTINGFEITENEFYINKNTTEEDYNNFGIAFRIDVPIYTYNIKVKTTCNIDDVIISICGNNGKRLLDTGHWDNACLVPIKHAAKASLDEWEYNYVASQGFIEIEVEPLKENVQVGIQEITITKVENDIRSENENKTIFTLGDSTVKSYIFAEAPMNGWGQVFDDMFDLEKVNVINYSMGGRSFKNSFNEGRFNDLLLSGKVGDYILIQFGHNDEREDNHTRYGRGSTEEQYKKYIKDVYIPAVRSRGMIPVLVTPMSRIDGTLDANGIFTNSFIKREFPKVMIEAAKELDVLLIDLNAESIKYYNDIGVEASQAIVMSIEAGETPGKTNDGSYANGHPSRKIDGTHYKEALSKQYVRIILTEFYKHSLKQNKVAVDIIEFLKDDVKEALKENNFENIFPEIAKDIVSGRGAYYRNQIEKLLKLKVLFKDENGNFNFDKEMQVNEYVEALNKIMNTNLDVNNYIYSNEQILTREVMTEIIYDAYTTFFKDKPKYMTDYNGKTITPDSSDYDPNLDSGEKGIMYYPIVSFEQLQDTKDISDALYNKLKEAYNLGLIRAEKGIERGKVLNGIEFEPKLKVTREKAAKTLYYMWVLRNPVNIEDDLNKLY